MLKSRSTLPPGGWVYRQAETNWASAFGLTFDETVEAIIKHRQANPRFNLPTDFNLVAIDLEIYTEKRLRQMQGTSSYFTDLDPKLMRPRTPQSDISGVAVGAKVSDSASLQVLINWLGNGLRPVLPELANKRAEICAGCPQNKQGDWKRWFTAPVAAVLHKQMERKAEMKLRTPSDDKLNVCDACSCQLTLKVWTPIEHIKDHTPGEVLARLDPRCWITKE